MTATTHGRSAPVRWSRRVYAAVNHRISPITFSATLEDHAMVEAALGVQQGDTVVCLASGGEIPIHLSRFSAQRVLAVDSSAPQVHLCLLKLRGLELLELDDFRALLGLGPRESSTPIYRSLRDELPGPTREFWDGRPDLVARGLLWCGAVQRQAHSMRYLVRVAVPAVSNNPYLAPLFFGPQSQATPLPYVDAFPFKMLKHQVGTVRVQHGDLVHTLGTLGDRSVARFALSNIYDWLTPSRMAQLLDQVRRVATPDARILLCARRNDLCSVLTRSWLEEDRTASRELKRLDRIGYFREIAVLNVRRPG